MSGFWAGRHPLSSRWRAPFTMAAPVGASNWRVRSGRFEFNQRFGAEEASVISLIFETRRFRVRLQDRIAYVESPERNTWIFRDQYSLPISPTALDGRREFATL